MRGLSRHATWSESSEWAVLESLRKELLLSPSTPATVAPKTPVRQPVSTAS